MPPKPEDQTVLSWKAPEFSHYRKAWWWFPSLALITLALSTFFILTKQYLASIIVVLGAITIYRLAHEEPTVWPVIFTPNGIKFKDSYWNFNQLKTFWIIEHHSAKSLYLSRIDRLTRPVVIPLVKQDITKVRDFLRHYLPEATEATEDISERLNRWLKI